MNIDKDTFSIWDARKTYFQCALHKSQMLKVSLCGVDHTGERTVAGEAASRSMGSKMRLVVGASWMISPDMRHSFLLSSSTVFMFSIHTASTGPSKISHFRSDVCNQSECVQRGLV